METQSVGLNRNTKDKFYTKPEIAAKYIDLFLNFVNPVFSDTIIEPSAGTGSFSDILKTKEYNILCYDIEPTKDYIHKTDFLSLETSQFKDNIFHCIGNPPFGRQSSLAKRFIKQCCEFSSSVAFILPKSFKKQAFYKAFPLHFHKVYEEDCPSHSFLVNEKEHDVPCVFQIWIKKEYKRDVEDMPTPNGFKYVSQADDPDFALRRVGFYAGKASSDYHSKNKQSHYFIKLDNKDNGSEALIEKLNQHVYDTNNTVGAKSISKAEFTKVLNSLITSSLS